MEHFDIAFSMNKYLSEIVFMVCGAASPPHRSQEKIVTDSL